MEPARQLRVAVVGSGMAGLVTAYLLHRDAEQRYDVTILEEVPLARPYWLLLLLVLTEDNRASDYLSMLPLCQFRTLLAAVRTESIFLCEHSLAASIAT
jgi:NAD(P)H-nitrite reductase large subunit